MSRCRVPESLAAMPARDFLRRHLGISTTLWKKIKHSGTFCLNGIPAIAAHTVVQGGDEISYELPQRQSIAPECLPLDIRYEDEWLLIVNKPAGQLVHPTVREAHGTLANAVLYHYRRAGCSAAFHPVHRLDRDTSGLVLIAKAPQIHYQLSPKGQKLFRREYLAIAHGIVTPAAGWIDAPIGRKDGSIIEREVRADGRTARTHYRVLAAGDGRSLLRLRLETGRTHQIRVHLAHIGHPLLGDDLYGGSRARIGRQALHAASLSLRHPVTGEPLSLCAPLPADMAAIAPCSP